MKKDIFRIYLLLFSICFLSCNPENSSNISLTNDGELGEYGSGSHGKFQYPQGMAIGLGNEIHIVDNTNKCIQVFDIDSLKYVREYSGNYFYPIAVAIDEVGESYVTDYGDAVLAFNSTGSQINKFSTKESGDRPFPYGISIDPKSQNIVVANNPTENSRISVWTQSGKFVNVWSSPKVFSVWVSSKSEIYAACWDKIIVYDMEGNILSQINTDYSVIGITGDNSNHLYVTYYYENKVQAYNQSSGSLICEFSLPSGDIPVQPYSGNYYGITSTSKYIFVTDRVNHKVIRLLISK
jgi:DNA-binding beta-propeller fold protein YncE